MAGNSNQFRCLNGGFWLLTAFAMRDAVFIGLQCPCYPKRPST